MAYFAALNTHRKVDGKIIKGCGLKVKNYVLTHYSSLGLNLNENQIFDKKTISSLPIQVYLDDKDPLNICNGVLTKKNKQLLEIIKIWSCETCQQFFKNNFNRKTFSNSKNIYLSATFILLVYKEDDVKIDHLNVEKILNLMDLTLNNECNVSQGCHVNLLDQKKKMFFRKTDLQSADEGIVSYNFIKGLLFTVDLALETSQEGSLIISRFPGGKNANYLGMVIYKDVLPYVMEVFPLCISLKHVLSSDCHSSSCHLYPKLLTIQDSLSIGLEAHYLFLVQCGSNAGSGSLISHGVILTCSHILNEQHNNEIMVYNKNQSYRAELLYKPSNNRWPDLALLQLKSDHLSSSIIEFSPDPPTVGNEVFAVGFPYLDGWLKKEPWISQGYIFSEDAIGNFVASCPVHEGFSGGCIVDNKGFMVGLICSKAIPINITTTSPLRLTQFIPTFKIKNSIMGFLTSARTIQDGKLLDSMIQGSRKSKLTSKL